MDSAASCYESAVTATLGDTDSAKLVPSLAKASVSKAGYWVSVAVKGSASEV